MTHSATHPDSRLTVPHPRPAEPGVREAGAHILTMWQDRHAVHVTVDGRADADLVGRLAVVLDGLVRSGGCHLVVDLHRLVGDEETVLDVLARTCRRLWRHRGVMELHGLRRRSETTFG